MIVVFVVVKTRMFTREELRNKIFQGNAIDVLKTFPSKSVEMCITSPPYWGLRDYQSEGIIWDSNNECEHDFSTKAPPRRNRSTDDFKFAGEVQKGNIGSSPNLPETSFCSKCSAWKGSLGLEPTHELYIKHLCDIFEETKRVLKDDATLWVNLGDTYSSSGGVVTEEHIKNAKVGATKSGAQLITSKWREKSRVQSVPDKSLVGVPFHFALEMINRGWILRNTLIWHKNNCMPSSVKDRFTVDFEYIFFFSMNKKYYFRQQFEPHTSKKQSSPISKVNNVVPYAVQPRDKEFIVYRKLPKHEDIRKFLVEYRIKKGITIDEIESHFGNSKGHHWFEKDTGSYPTVEDWRELKKILDFDDRFDFSMTTEYEKSSEKTRSEFGRNKRTVWKVNTKPYKEAHFAVFPEELIETPIKAGCPEFVCVTCGHSREEKFESLSTKDYSNESDYKRQIDLEHGQSAFNRNQATFDSVSYNSKGLSDCGCGDEFKRGMVLDIFAGSGTTAVVAKKNNRDYIGIELNGDYIDMCKERLESYNNHHLDLWTQGNRTQQNKASRA